MYQYLYMNEQKRLTAVLWIQIMNLDPDPGFWLNLDPDQGYTINFERKN